MEIKTEKEDRKIFFIIFVYSNKIFTLNIPLIKL